MADQTPAPAIEVRDLTKSFRVNGRDVHALNGVSLAVGHAETLGIVGESGSGKSTLGRIVVGLETMSSGEILHEGTAISGVGRAERNARLAKCQMIFQDPYASLDPRQTVSSILTEPLAIHRLEKPVVAALPGPAAGAGLSIALSCDLRVMAESAFVTTSYARLGLSGDYGGSWFMTRLVGTAKARELYFTSERVDAGACLELGLANRVVPDADLDKEALALAKRIAAGPPVALRYMKDNLNRALTEDLHALLDVECDRMVQSAQTEDYVEAVQAFQEKRAPEFKGR